MQPASSHDLQARSFRAEKLTEKKMFGGLAMLIGGTMAVGVHKDSLIARVDPARHEEYLAEPGLPPK